MLADDIQRMVGSECVAFIDQFGTFERTHKLIVKTLFFKFALYHLLAHFGDAAVERNSHTSLDAPIVAALIAAAD